MATVRRRIWDDSDGRKKMAWQVSFMDQAGKRHREQFPTKRQADDRRLEVETSIKQRTYREQAHKLKVSDVAALYLAKLKERVDAGEMEQVSRDDVETKLRVHILHPERGIGAMLLADVGPKEADDLYLAIRSTGLSAATGKSVLRVLRAMLSWAVEQNLIAVNRLRGHQKKRVDRDKKKVNVPTHEQVRRLIAEAAGILSQWIMFAALTGLRAGEQWGLKWKYICLRENKIYVRSRVDRYRKDGAPKSQAGNRSVPLPPVLARRLKELKLRSGDGEYVFPNGRGKPQIHANVMQRKFRPLCRKLGIAITWHQLRHYYASCLIDEDLSAKEIQERMGHASIQTTMDIYGHLFPKAEDGAELAGIEARILDDGAG